MTNTVIIRANGYTVELDYDTQTATVLKGDLYLVRDAWDDDPNFRHWTVK